MLIEEIGSRQRRGVERRFVDRDAHLIELVLQVAWSPLAVVREEEKLVSAGAEPLDKIESAGYQAAAVVNHAVHVDHEADRHRGSSSIGEVPFKET